MTYLETRLAEIKAAHAAGSVGQSTLRATGSNRQRRRKKATSKELSTPILLIEDKDPQPISLFRGLAEQIRQEDTELEE